MLLIVRAISGRGDQRPRIDHALGPGIQAIGDAGAIGLVRNVERTRAC